MISSFFTHLVIREAYSVAGYRNYAGYHEFTSEKKILVFTASKQFTVLSHQLNSLCPSEVLTISKHGETTLNISTRKMVYSGYKSAPESPRSTRF